MRKLFSFLSICFLVAPLALADGTKQNAITTTTQFGRDILKLETADEWRAVLGIGIGSGTGNVTGPNVSTNGHIAVFGNGSGNQINDLGLAISDIVVQNIFQNFTNSLQSMAFRKTNDFVTTGNTTWQNGELITFGQRSNNIVGTGFTTNSFVFPTTWNSLSGEIPILFGGPNVIRGSGFRTNDFLMRPSGDGANTNFAIIDKNGGLHFARLGTNLSYDAPTATINVTGGASGSVTNVSFYPSAWATWTTVGGSNQVNINTNFADPAGSATASTNGLGLSSGLAANVSTNRFAPTNAPTVYNPAINFNSSFTNFANDYAGQWLAKAYVGGTNVGGILMGHVGNLSPFAPRDDSFGYAFFVLDDTAGIGTTNIGGGFTGYGDLWAAQNFDIGSGIFHIDAGGYPDAYLTNSAGGALYFGTTPTFSKLATSSTNLAGLDINGKPFGITIGSGLSYSASTKTLSAPTGGSGTVTSVGLTAPAEFTVSGTPVTGSGTLSFSRTGDANYVGKSLTNSANGVFTNSLAVGGAKASADSTNVVEVSTLGGQRALMLDTNATLHLSKSAYIADKKVVTSADVLAFGTINDGQFLKATAVGGVTNITSTLQGWGLTNLNTWDSLSNNFSGTTFYLGTNSVISTSSDVGLISIGNLPPTGIERWGQLTIVCGGNINITNAIPGWKTSDMVYTRLGTNGNSVVVALDVMTGFFTNAAILQFH